MQAKWYKIKDLQSYGGTTYSTGQVTAVLPTLQVKFGSTLYSTV